VLSNSIQRVVLDPMKVTRIFVAQDRLTTVRFPSPISALESARVTTEPHPEALFQLSFNPGEPFFSVKAMAPEGMTSLNVIWKGDTYVLELVESSTPWISVVFEAPIPPDSRTAPSPPSTSRLMGRIDMAKAYALLKQQHPLAVLGVEVVRPNTLRDYGDYTILTEEVFRFERDDLLVFRVVIRNKTSTPIHFVPASLMVRAGTRIYPQCITDATGILPSQVDVPVYFGITGDVFGSRADLSPMNDFLVLLNRLPTAPPTRVEASREVPALRTVIIPREVSDQQKADSRPRPNLWRRIWPWSPHRRN
jgi:hypothetical protein